ncbi:beta-lactamase/transpeptidase-like protein [Thozetella sp. PMI_491]|nr:beta-lactamase/transpeptidase-like protein [Thozetella sp. PMI_491]
MSRSRHDASYLGPRAVHTDDARSVTRNLRNLAIAAPLRTKYMYNNMMYTVASYLVEKRSGLSFAEFLESHFFEPLGMASSNLQFERARAKGLGDRIATSYHWDKESESYKGFQSPDAPEAQGAGSVVTSANDYIKWVKAIMNHEAPITEEIYKGLIRARSLPNPDYAQLNPYTSPKVYAAGWEVSYYRGHMMVYHAGAIPGVGTRHWFLPAHKFGGVIFGNGDKAYIVAAILMQELIDALLEISEDQKPDWDKVFKDYSAAMEGDEDNVAELREQLSPGLKEDEPQKMPLEAYTGEYWNPGYHGMKVEIREGKLFIDATDRSFGSTITFDHVCEQTKYIAHVSDFFEGGDMPFRAEFKFDNDRTTKMGLHLEDALEEYIWFDRVNDKGDEEKSA